MAHGRTAGFTLVEMLVAVLLFGIIASIATALTVTSTRSFSATDSALQHLAAIETARAILAADLGQAAQRPSLAADGAVLPAFTLTHAGFVFVRAGVGGIRPQVQKIAWGFDGKRLLRQTFPAVDGTLPGDTVEVLRDLRAIRIRVASDSGWRSQWRPQKPDELPRAVEIALLDAHGQSTTLKFLVAA
jgi:general secretion pathway protein J